MKRIAQKLLTWYEEHGRILPWRGLADPYAIWVSEIMLQQTRVETVIPYFEKWMKRFPTMAILAGANEQEVLNLWEGLGYYSRARNLLEAARIIRSEYEGEVPHSMTDLRKLPGVGRYTAGAIASMAFDMDEPTMDGNIRRVFARIINLEIPANSSEGVKKLWTFAAENLPKGRAGDYNQAIMDLGAIICLPKRPLCRLCPVAKACQAQKTGVQEMRPVLKPKVEVPTVQQAAVVIVQRGRVLLNKRPSEGLLGGLWEFPNGRVPSDPGKGMVNAVKKEYGIAIRKGETLGIIRHTYSHFKTVVHVYSGSLAGGMPVGGKKGRVTKKFKWVKLSELEIFPMGKIDRQIARKFTSRRPS
jgi:A/G-specific adenine glycosylase